MRRCLAVAIAAAILGCGPDDSPRPTALFAEPIAPALRPTSIRDPEQHWERGGYLELISSAADGGLVHVWLRLPHRAVLRVAQDHQRRPQLQLPAGAVIERVETRRYETPFGAERHAVVDVRGLRIADDDQHRWHVMRPASHAPRSPLLGWSWPVDDGVAQEEATRRLERFLRRHRAPESGAAIAEDEIARLLRQNECGRCHRAQKDALAIAPSSPGLDEAEVNDALAMVLEPLGRDDAKQDAYGRRVCATRRALYRQMDAAGRRAFAESFRECGVR